MEQTLTAKKDLKITEGRLFWKIVLFIIPAALTNLLQMFYNAADMIIVGLSGEADAVGAIGTTGAFVNSILQLIFGFAAGVNVIVAYFIGQKSGDKVAKSVHTAIISGTILGFLAGGLGIGITYPVLTLLGDEGKVLELAGTYSIIYFCGAPFMALTNCSASIFRAKGDTKTPLIVLSLSGILNILLNLFFVLVFSMSVEGVAFATVIANIASSVVLLFLLTRLKDDCRFEFKKCRIDRHAFIRICKIGIPAAIQGVLFGISNMIIQSSIIRVNDILVPNGSEYQPVLKGHTVGGNLEGFIYAITDAIALATVTFVGQNGGAKKYDRVKKSVLYCGLITTIVCFVAVGIIFLLKNFFFSLYGVYVGAEGSLDRLAYNAATIRLLYMVVPYFTLGLMNAYAGAVRGMGYSLTATMITLITVCVLRVIWIYTVFAQVLTLESVYISYPISWTLASVCQFICFAIVLKKRRTHYEQKQLLLQNK